MLHERFDELRDGGQLPSPSGVGLRILELTRDEDYSLDDLAAAIQSDPALTAQILRISNSAIRASQTPVTSVREAAMRLGTNTVRTVALGFTLITANHTGVCENFDYDGYWAWSLACGGACQRLAGYEGWEPAEAFTCGLLSHIGMLALATVHPSAYSRLLGRVSWDQRSKLLREENRAFHIDHVDASASMMIEWGLPKEFADLVRVLRQTHLPTPDSLEEIPHANVLLCADRLASLCLNDDEFGHAGWGVGNATLEGIAAAMGISMVELLELCTDLREEWDSWITALGLHPDSNKRLTGEAEPAPAEESDDPEESFDLDADLTESPVPEEIGEQDLRVRILVAEDDPRQQRLLVHFLDDEQFEVRKAADGAEALRIAVEWNPDILITDWMMPEMTGVELCQALRKTEAGRSMYILILTAREDEDRIVEAFKAGVDDYITKPFNPRILKARVGAGKRLIRLQRLVDQDKRYRMQQVAEMGRLTRKLRSAAMTDSLTELPNRRYAMKRLEDEWKSARSNGRPLSCIMIDIDFFKRVNDDYGHDAGDVVLRETAATLRAQTRLGDVVCRLGGEEFLVIAVNCGLEAAMNCAERLRVGVEQNHIDWGTFNGNVTVSQGVAQMTPDMLNIDQLMKMADEAVYDAKEGGRNRVETRTVIDLDDPAADCA